MTTIPVGAEVEPHFLANRRPRCEYFPFTVDTMLGEAPAALAIGQPNGSEEKDDEALAGIVALNAPQGAVGDVETQLRKPWPKRISN